MKKDIEMEDFKIGDYVAYKHVPEGLLCLGYFHNFEGQQGIMKYKVIAICDNKTPMLIHVRE